MNSRLPREILLVGGAGSGKDTVAGMLADHGGWSIGQADPLKRFAARVFGYSTAVLWGSTELREGRAPNDWRTAEVLLASPWVREWLGEVLGTSSHERLDAAEHALDSWFVDLRAEHAIRMGRALVYGWTQPTARRVLQTLGTEWGRALDGETWTDYAGTVAEAVLDGGALYHRAIGLMWDERFPTPSFVVITDGRFPNEAAAVRRRGGIVVGLINPEAPPVPPDAHASERLVAGMIAAADYWITNDKRDGLEALRRKVAALLVSIR